MWSHGWKEKRVTRLQEITVAFDRQRNLPTDDIADLVALMLSQPVAPRAGLYMQQGSLKCRLRTERNQKFGFNAIDPVTSEPHPAEHRSLALAHDDSFWRGIITQKLGNGQAKPFRKAVQSIERGSGLSILDFREKAFRATRYRGEICQSHASHGSCMTKLQPKSGKFVLGRCFVHMLSMC